MSATPMARRFWLRLRSGGPAWLASAIRDRVFPRRLAMTPAVLAATTGGCGLEVGGPSRVFGRRGLAPVYEVAARIDNVNFASETAWEGALRDGGEFRFDAAKPPGTQWVREAGELSGIADGAYDFVLSSHCLEHLANPLGALREWRRVVRAGGHLLIVVPDPSRSFDHGRPITTLAHLQADAAQCTGEQDATHFAEVLALHDLGRDPDAGTPEEFRARVARNARDRCVHHHVFDPSLLGAALAEAGWRVLAREAARPVHLVAFAQKEAG